MVHHTGVKTTNRPLNVRPLSTADNMCGNPREYVLYETTQVFW